MKAAPRESISIDGNSAKLRSRGSPCRVLMSQSKPSRQISPVWIVFSFTLLTAKAGFALRASSDWARCRSQTLDSLFAPGVRYQMTSTRPGSPATIHGITLVPLSVVGLTRIGADQVWPRLVDVASEIFAPSDQTT